MNQEQLQAALVNYLRGSIRHQADVERIVSVAQRMGLTMSDVEAQWIWEEHSDISAASWLIIESDEEIEHAIRSFVDSFGGERS